MTEVAASLAGDGLAREFTQKVVDVIKPLKYSAKMATLSTAIMAVCLEELRNNPETDLESLKMTLAEGMFYTMQGISEELGEKK